MSNTASEKIYYPKSVLLLVGGWLLIVLLLSVASFTFVGAELTGSASLLWKTGSVSILIATLGVGVVLITEKYKWLLIMLLFFTLGWSLMISSNFFISQKIEPPEKNKETRISSAQDMIALINRTREDYGLEPLRENAKLQASATDKACDMIERNYYGHLDPDNRETWYLMEKNGYIVAYAGENLIDGFANDEEAFQALMASEKHKSNILSDNFKDIGVGRCGSYTVQHFGTQKYD